MTTEIHPKSRAKFSVSHEYESRNSRRPSRVLRIDDGEGGAVNVYLSPEQIESLRAVLERAASLEAAP